MGIEDDRFRLEWISAAEADRLRDVMNDMTAKLKKLGPLHMEVPDEKFEMHVEAAKQKAEAL
jgi:coenzyme F420-reducing hydrogenase delta subunit